MMATVKTNKIDGQDDAVLICSRGGVGDTVGIVVGMDVGGMSVEVPVFCRETGFSSGGTSLSSQTSLSGMTVASNCLPPIVTWASYGLGASSFVGRAGK